LEIEAVETLAIRDLKVIRFGRFSDERGYFSEPYRLEDLAIHPETSFLCDVQFVQINESYSRAGVVRGLHFQWNPYMGKLVRAVRGRVVDLALDIRRGSPTLGKMVTRDISEVPGANYGQWIWVPPGFAHGIFCTTDCVLEYLCTGEYSPGSEAGISPLAPDIDWAVADPEHKYAFDEIVAKDAIMSAKDNNAYSLKDWLADERSSNFQF